MHIVHVFVHVKAECIDAFQAATQTAADAQVLLFALLLDDDPGTRAYQRNLVASRSGGDALRALDDLIPSLAVLRPEQKLPLLQLALPRAAPAPPHRPRPVPRYAR